MCQECSQRAAAAFGGEDMKALQIRTPTGDIFIECRQCGGKFYENRKHECAEPLTADDIRSAKLDREPWGNGSVHPEVAYAVLVQVMRSIRDEQPTASAVIRGLAAAALEAIE